MRGNPIRTKSEFTRPKSLSKMKPINRPSAADAAMNGTRKHVR